MEKIKLSEFTLEKIKNREFEQVIPELYELEEVIENNLWHNNDPVFNHVISVSTELNKLFEEVNDKIKAYLAEKIKNYSRKDLLILAAVFHDIGKKETLKDAVFLGHEKMGAEKIFNIISRFDLAEKEREFVIKLVGNHGFIHDILNYPADKPEEKWQKFREENPDISLEVVLLTKADTLVSHLKNSKPKEFAFRISFIDKIIDSY
jgi:putative nucleotidyltransferase with HDIG domain